MGRSTWPNWISDDRLVSVHVDGEGHLEQAVVLVPVHFGVNHQDPATGGQPQDLDGPGGAEGVLDLDGRFFGAAGQDRDALRRAPDPGGHGGKRRRRPRPATCWGSRGGAGGRLPTAPGGMTSRPASRSTNETMWPSRVELDPDQVVLEATAVRWHHCRRIRACSAGGHLPADRAGNALPAVRGGVEGHGHCPRPHTGRRWRAR